MKGTLIGENEVESGADARAQMAFFGDSLNSVEQHKAEESGP